jgi:hypothetical protein
MFMRLISQNGMCDCPYESSSVYIRDMETKCGETSKESGRCTIQCNNNIASFKIAEYSTKEKALCVMEMLQQQYMRHLTTVLSDVKAESTYFKFPTDEES